MKRVTYWTSEVRAQQCLLCGTVFSDTSKLRALLRNTTFQGTILRLFLWNLIGNAKTDNGEAVTILLKDGRCQVEANMFNAVLRKDFTAMGAALEKHDTVKTAIQVCAKCNTNPGIYSCHRGFECKDFAESDSDNEDYSAWSLPKVCRPCALASGSKFCAQCEDWLCRTCLKAKNCNLCERCGANICDKEDRNYRQGIDKCAGCGRKECQMCTAEYGNDWHHCCGINPPCYCPKCKVKPKYAVEFDY